MNNMSLDAFDSSPVDLAIWFQTTTSDNGLHLQRLRQKLNQALLTELTPRQREVVTMHYLHRLSSAEISRKLGVNRSTVCRTIHRAENRLRHCLEYTL